MNTKSMSKRRSRTQLGALMVEVSLALVISALAAVGTMSEAARVEVMRSADVEADSLDLYRLALQHYTDDAYQELQLGSPVTRLATTLLDGSGPGQTRQPTVAQLIAMGYLSPGFTNTTMLVDGGSYQNQISRLPVGCVGVACNIEGLAWIDRPFLARGSADTNGPVIGQMLSRLGGFGGTSIEGSTATITGAGAAWSSPNPLPGNPAGVMAARFGVTAASLLMYVRIGDVRDPNLAGNLTIAGNTQLNGTLNVAGATTLNSTLTTNGATTLNGPTTVNNTLNVTGPVTSTADISSSTNVGTTDGVAACLRAALTSTGNIIARSVACLDRITLNGSAGTLAMNDNTGTNRVQVAADTGSMALKNAGGGQTVLLDSTSGRMLSNVGNFQTMATGGTSCAAFTAGDIAQDAAASGTLLVCRGGVWRRTGLEQAVAGDPCPTLGVLAQTSSNEALICRGTWQALNDRVSPTVAMALWSGNGSASVPTPACGVGGTPDITVAALQSGADYGGLPPRNRFEIRVTGSGPWNLDPVLVDTSGTGYSTSFTAVPYSFGWTATTYCQYPT